MKSKSKLLSILLVACMVVAFIPVWTVPVSATTAPIPWSCGVAGNEDSVLATLSDEDNDSVYETLTISGTGAMRDYDIRVAFAPWHDHQDYVTTVVVDQGVTRVGDNAFWNMIKVTSVTLSDTVESIGYSAFDACTLLTSINIPASVNYIDHSAFANCTELTAFTVASENTVYSATDGIIFDKSGETIAFYPAGKPGTSYTIPSGVKVISDGALSYSTSLTAITIPASVEVSGEGTFPNGRNLASVTVDSANANYKSEDGVLFTKDGKTLIAYPSKKTNTSYTVPASVTKLASGAFNSCNNLQEFSVGAIDEICPNNFTGCNGIRVLTLGAAVIRGAGSFFNNSNLQ
ncbi:MAG: leucine-rich repeat protein, partial [Firmicutes bacterium]|nr:leucine-rich repeat protein [Bacillota bacterium]